jgi:hypothetical protein
MKPSTGITRSHSGERIPQNSNASLNNSLIGSTRSIKTEALPCGNPLFSETKWLAPRLKPSQCYGRTYLPSFVATTDDLTVAIPVWALAHASMSKANLANRWRSMVERLSCLPRVRRVWFVLAALAFEQLKTNTLLMYFRYGARNAKIRGLRSPVPVRPVVPFSPCCFVSDPRRPAEPL